MSELQTPNPAPAPPPSPKPRSTICPYCGSRSRSLSRCDACKGLFDPLSRQATQNAMGPWFIRDDARPHRPGCSYETLVRLVERGQITPDTVLRGPATLQFWTIARWCPGIAHLLGFCHSCHRAVDPLEPACRHCGASFRVSRDRQHMGLGEVRFVPGRAESPEAVPVIRAAEPSPALRAERRAEVAPDPIETPDSSRQHRLERELRRARRWQATLGAVLTVVVLAGAAMLTIPALDLEAGPFGRWLGAAERAPAPVEDPSLTGDIPEIVASGPGGAEQKTRGEAGQGGETSESLQEGPRPEGPADPGADAPGEVTGGGSAEVGGLDSDQPTASLEAFTRLRRLR